VRFQDAARDARAVVYAGIQADPLVARAASLLADATLEQRVLARAVMNGETTDADAWRTMFLRLFFEKRIGTIERAYKLARVKQKLLRRWAMMTSDQG